MAAPTKTEIENKRDECQLLFEQVQESNYDPELIKKFKARIDDLSRRRKDVIGEETKEAKEQLMIALNSGLSAYDAEYQIKTTALILRAGKMEFVLDKDGLREKSKRTPSKQPVFIECLFADGTKQEFKKHVDVYNLLNNTKLTAKPIKAHLETRIQHVLNC